jgi:hypothetical protein
MLTAQPRAIANVAPVHTFFMRYLQIDSQTFVQSQRHDVIIEMFPVHATRFPHEPWRSCVRVRNRNWAE